MSEAKDDTGDRRVLITELMDETALARLERHVQVSFDPELHARDADLEAMISGYHGLIVRNRTQVSRRLIEAASDLMVIGRLGVGLDNIDLVAAKERDIAVCPATGANAAAVAEYVVTTAMLLLRPAYSSSQDLLDGAWPRMTLGTGRELSGCRFGLVGFGSIGRAVAERVRAFGAPVITYDLRLEGGNNPGVDGVTVASLDQVLTESDVISLHVPLVDETRHLIDREQIRRMKQGAILINTARGGIVDEQAVADALRAGQLAGAALDVFENEPLTRMDRDRFRDVPNLLLTPHIAGVTVDSNRSIGELTVTNVLRGLGCG